MALSPTSSRGVTLGGTAGGDLTGTYPSPTIGAGKVVLADLATAAIDATMPWYIEIDPLATPTANSGFTSFYNSAGSVYGGTARQNNAQNDSIGWDVMLAAGTWTLSILLVKDGTGGIMTVAIDGVTAGTLDTYNAGEQDNQVMAITGIAVAATGKKRLAITMATKNVAASQYIGYLQHLTLLRTA